MFNKIAFLDLTWGMLGVQLCGFYFLMASFQQNTNRRIVAHQIGANSLFSVFYYLCRAYTGSALNALGILRGAIFFFRPNKDGSSWGYKWADHIIWAYVFCGLFIAAGIVTWNPPLSLFPTFAMLLNTVGTYCKRPKITRRLALAAQTGWFAHNLIIFLTEPDGTKMVLAVLTDTFILGSILVGMWRYDRKRESGKSS